eukprot:scaffold20465_cov81-Phaeocystis_antarctica.AAC.2
MVENRCVVYFDDLCPGHVRLGGLGALAGHRRPVLGQILLPLHERRVRDVLLTLLHHELAGVEVLGERARLRGEAGDHLRRAERLAGRRELRGGVQGEGRHMQCVDERRLEARLAWRPCSVPGIPRRSGALHGTIPALRTVTTPAPSGGSGRGDGAERVGGAGRGVWRRAVGGGHHGRGTLGSRERGSGR